MSSYKAQGIIEGIAVRRRKEESSRVFLTISIPAAANESLVLSAIRNQGNAIDFGLEILQGSMLDEPLDDDDEEGHPEPPESELATIFTIDGTPEGKPHTLNPTADAMINESRRAVDPEEAAQAEENLKARSNGRGRGRPIGLPADPPPSYT